MITEENCIYFYRRRYFTNLTFLSVMKASELMKEELISPQKRVDKALFLLLRTRSYFLAMTLPKGKRLMLLGAVLDSLGGGDCKGIISFTEDFPLIYSAFRQCYSIDLLHDEIAWREFVMLAGAIPQDCALFYKMKARAENMTKPFAEGIAAIFEYLGGRKA